MANHPPLKIDPDKLQHGLGSEPFAVHHDLVDNPLLTLDAIADLADYLPADSIEHNLGDLPEVLPDADAVTRLDLSPGEIVRTVESNRSWMVLKWIERHPDYRDLLEQTLSEVTSAVAVTDGPVHGREGFIFISAPNSVTPSHIDPEYNFLLQTRGTKEMVVGRHASSEAELETVERYYGGAHRNIDLTPENAQTFEMNPGDGVFVPLHAPHLVRNGPEPSISLSVTWSTEESKRVAALHSVNARLRSLHLSPAAPGARPAVDRVKLSGYLAARSAARAARRIRTRQPA